VSEENTVTSTGATRKNPSQGKFKSGIKDKRNAMRIDVNKHGIRRETVVGPKKVGRKKI
jgi:hypothetical protein